MKQLRKDPLVACINQTKYEYHFQRHDQQFNRDVYRVAGQDITEKNERHNHQVLEDEYTQDRPPVVRRKFRSLLEKLQYQCRTA